MGTVRAKVARGLGVLVAVGVVLLAMAWLSGVFRSGVIQPEKLASSAAPATTATAYSVTTTKKIEMADLVGTVQSEARTQVSSRIQANVVEMKVDAGSQVKAGEVIAQLDDRDLKARLEQAKEMLRSAEARRDRAARRVERLALLIPQRAASQDELDEWDAQHKAAAAEAAGLQQRIREAEILLSDARITSPINGIVIERLADPGDMAAPGKGLATIYDPANLRLEAIAREGFISRLEAMRVAKTPVSVFIDSEQREVQGTITQIVPAADPQSRSFVVKVHLSDAKGLYPGMFGRLRVPLGETQMIEIPRAAVREVGQVTMVSVTSGGHVESRAVRLGQPRGERVEVLAGLSAGEQIMLAR